ncbi:MAG: hypothetical protein A2Y62_21625 [Candidatus Fischerbacteria bacterium RBG_13_37_8]|uniref:4Fe-4S ferredoxin-type domain-containing protein n=1 Tax=Candidatus Fischerbacteria bacterium RBG_13_37_8 TaxID=1817863 RepID=A0A1F5VWV7_9BACT|nr:MAG: hypothetical protein A2Y62_21625 [Candidatus Fischerbacteria bacterium RBG_13_37_8]
MNDQQYPVHYVCTKEEALNLINQHKKFWLSDCGCRVGKGSVCKQSRIDVCLYFTDTWEGMGSPLRSISKKEALLVLEESKNKNLVSRPFRNPKDKNITDGVCFCCNDCCAYFLCPDEVCDNGKYRESTDMEKCNLCGICVDLCYFHARKIENDQMIVIKDNCYRCGICAEICPEVSIQMILREQE